MQKDYYTLAELAAKYAVDFAGDGDCKITHVADLQSADVGSISFFVNKSLEKFLSTTQASCIIISPENIELCKKPALLTGNPYALYAKIAALLHPDQDIVAPPGIHKTALVHGSADIDPNAIIGPNVVIEQNVKIGPHSYIGAGCVIGKNVIIGSYTKLNANVSVYSDSVIGNRTLIHSSAVIGSDGFGFAPEAGKWIKIPQLGKVIVQDDVEVGAGTAIDRGALKDTIIEAGVKLDNQIHIAHNVTVGKDTAIAAQSGVAGSTSIGTSCTVGGSVGILGHLKIANRVHFDAFSQVSQSITEEGSSHSSGVPLQPSQLWKRNWVRIKQLDTMAKRITALEKQISDQKNSN